VDRRAFLGAVTGSLLAAPLAGGAQQAGKVVRIGRLEQGSAPSRAATGTDGNFRQGLRELGYVEGQNVLIEYRYAEGKAERLADLAAELVSLKVDVIVAGGTLAPLAAKHATSTIPIVLAACGDPVGTGLVASLAKPGGNVTGLSNRSADLTAKNLQLLKEVVPAVSRVAVLWNAGNPISALVMRETEAAARVLGLQIQSLEVHGPDDFESVLPAAISGGVGALFVVDDPLIYVRATRITEFATRSRLPTTSYHKGFVQAGGLMAYGADLADNYRRAAILVDKILKGAKAGDLPVEQPTKFLLVINMKTAKVLGLTIPQSVLLRADEVIQ
jgi:putative tryptophan/tyrosine transport system substrate-binding protein